MRLPYYLSSSVGNSVKPVQTTSPPLPPLDKRRIKVNVCEEMGIRILPNAILCWEIIYIQIPFALAPHQTKVIPPHHILSIPFRCIDGILHYRVIKLYQ